MAYVDGIAYVIVAGIAYGIAVGIANADGIKGSITAISSMTGPAAVGTTTSSRTTASATGTGEVFAALFFFGFDLPPMDAAPPAARQQQQHKTAKRIQIHTCKIDPEDPEARDPKEPEEAEEA
jgi:hypothetical protein